MRTAGNINLARSRLRLIERRRRRSMGKIVLLEQIGRDGSLSPGERMLGRFQHWHSSEARTHYERASY